jgi:tight adherence protein B
VPLGEEDAVPLLVALVTFVFVALIVVSIWFSVGNDSTQKVVRQRMEAVRKAEKRGDIPTDLKLIRDEMYSTMPMLHRALMRMSWTGRLRDYIIQAGMDTKPGKLLLTSAIAGLAAFVVVADFLNVNFLFAILAFIVASVVPISIVAFQRRRRLAKFEEHFPDALDLLGRAVRAGHPFTSGLEMISKESSEPIAGEFRKTFEEQNFGLPLRDALLNMTSRVPIVDVRFFVTALMIQKETGGNLAEILDELSRVIRDRFRIYREVQVRTAQGRLTAMILIALPLGMMLILEVVNPTYLRVMFEDPMGPPMLGIAAGLQILGSLIIWKIVHIEV